MMNEHIIKLALEAGILNYVDNETPRNYFVDANADVEELTKFAELIVEECLSHCEDERDLRAIKDHFGVDDDYKN